MNTLTCIIADDEPIARQILESYIEAIPYLELKASCKNAFEVMEQLQHQHIDILFLDINMPKFSGISLLKSLTVKPSVIITTAYPEYAITGFELAVTDYLLKPFSLERCVQAVLKVRKSMTQDLASNQANEQAKSDAKPQNTSLFVKSDKKIIKINVETISHIEAYGNYIKIFTEKMILTPQTLADFLSKLPEGFVRIHKSFVINFNYIQLIEGNQIVLQNGTKLPIGKSYKKEILERILS